MKTIESIISECATANNLGIQYEKEGNIDAAIEVYEKNILLDYPATHSYERLMLLYRKQKEYRNEIRVIERAISVFSIENERRAQSATKLYPSFSCEIQEALKSCTKVCDYNDINEYGYAKVIFNPYDVNKYRRRLEKVIKLSGSSNML